MRNIGIDFAFAQV